MDNILEINNLSMGFLLEDDNLDKKFYYALNNINLSFEKEKIHCIAGESGCGKSVLINTILDLLPKNALIKSGSIKFKNQELLSDRKIIKTLRGHKISLIPQDPFMSLDPLYTIENQLSEVVNEKNNKDAVIKEALEKVKIKNIDNVLKSYPHELSGGMKQRVIIAMSLISDSEIILADEPTTALDVSSSNTVLNILKDLKNLGKTIILITHDLSIVANYSDTTTIMYLGEIVETGKTQDIFKNPYHPYTNALLNAIVRPDTKKLENIKGAISPITENISGCKFHPRCNCVMPECKLNKPKLTKINNTLVSCLKYKS